MNRAQGYLLVWTATGMLTGAASGLSGSVRGARDVVPLPASEMEQSLGGACPNITCASVTCRNRGCQQYGTFCHTIPFPGKCLKHIENNYARCTGTLAGMTCSETSGAGCVSVKVGDSVPGDNPCPEANCTVDTGSCGDLSYTCTATDCPS